MWYKATRYIIRRPSCRLHMRTMHKY